MTEMMMELAHEDFKCSYYKYVQGLKGQYEPNEEKKDTIRKENQP